MLIISYRPRDDQFWIGRTMAEAGAELKTIKPVVRPCSVKAYGRYFAYFPCSKVGFSDLRIDKYSSRVN